VKPEKLFRVRDAYELVFTSDAGDGTEEVIAIPERLLEKGGEIKGENCHSLFASKNSGKLRACFSRAHAAKRSAANDQRRASHFDFRPAPEQKQWTREIFRRRCWEIGCPGGSLGDGWCPIGRVEEGIGVVNVRNYAQKMVRRWRIESSAAQPNRKAIEAAGKKFSLTIGPSERIGLSP